MVLTIATAFAAKGYVFTQKYIGVSNTNITVSWYVTENNCKMKMIFGNGQLNSTSWFLPDMEGGQLLSYNEGPVPPGVQKAYYKLPIDKLRVNSSNEVTRIAVQKTSESKEIGGLTCEKYIIKTNKTETEVWVTKKFSPAFYRYYPFFKDHAALAGLSEEKIAGFPIESVTKDLTGKTISAYQFISVNEAELSDADFKVPAEYKSAEEIQQNSK
jgi:hypothetical protein